jgi:hypothetical protein
MTYHPIATTLLALGLATSAAHAQHAVTMTVAGNDAAIFTVRTDGQVPVVGVELLAGNGATFTTGTDGDLSWAHWAGPDHYRVTTLTGEGSFALNFDGVSTGDRPFSQQVTSPLAWVGSRATVTWADGFYAIVPTSRDLNPATFAFTDIPPVPEPTSAALMLAGLAIIATWSRHARRD